MRNKQISNSQEIWTLHDVWMINNVLSAYSLIQPRYVVSLQPLKYNSIILYYKSCKFSFSFSLFCGQRKNDVEKLKMRVFYAWSLINCIKRTTRIPIKKAKAFFFRYRKQSLSHQSKSIDAKENLRIFKPIYIQSRALDANHFPNKTCISFSSISVQCRAIADSSEPAT